MVWWSSGCNESGLHQNWMRDYDPTTGRYVQADPLGLVDGSSVFGYAMQSPYRYTDPTGEYVWIIPIVVGAAISIGIDYLLDQAIGDGCYSLEEALVAGIFGSVGGGLGFLRYGYKWKKSLEFSHSVPTRMLNKSQFGLWLNKGSNPYKALNGNYVTTKTHALTDYYRRIKGVPAGKMYPPAVRYVLRTPAWILGSVGGGVVSSAWPQQ